MAAAKSNNESHVTQRQYSQLSVDAVPSIWPVQEHEQHSSISGEQSQTNAYREGSQQRAMHPSLSDSSLKPSEAQHPSNRSESSSQLVVSASRQVVASSGDSIPVKKGSSCDSDSMQQLIDDYYHEMPPHIKIGYFDVMILYSENDREAAEIYRDHLTDDIELERGNKVKAVLYDGAELMSLSGSQFKGLQEGFDRCTFVFVYLTRSFCECEWCSLSSEGCLMAAIENPQKRWCVVPVYTVQRSKADFKIPMGLNSLKGVNYYSNDDFYRRGLKRLIGDRLHIRIEHEKRHFLKQYKWACEQRNRDLVRQRTYRMREEEENRKHEGFKNYLAQQQEYQRNYQPSVTHQYVPSGYHDAHDPSQKSSHLFNENISSVGASQCTGGSRSMVTKLPSESIDPEFEKQQIQFQTQTSCPSQSLGSKPSESSSLSVGPQVGGMRPSQRMDDSHNMMENPGIHSVSLPVQSSNSQSQALKEEIAKFKSLSPGLSGGNKSTRLVNRARREPTESMEEVVPGKSGESSVSLPEADGGVSYRSEATNPSIMAYSNSSLQSRSLDCDHSSSRSELPPEKRTLTEGFQPPGYEHLLEKMEDPKNRNEKEKIIIHEHHHYYERSSERSVVKNINIIGAQNVIVGKNGKIISGSKDDGTNEDDDDSDDDGDEDQDESATPRTQIKTTTPSTVHEVPSSISSSVREDGGSKVGSSVGVTGVFRSEGPRVLDMPVNEGVKKSESSNLRDSQKVAPVSPVSSNQQESPEVAPVLPERSNLRDSQKVAPVSSVSSNQQESQKVAPVLPERSNLRDSQKVAPVLPVPSNEQESQKAAFVSPVSSSQQDSKRVASVSPISSKQRESQKVAPVATVPPFRPTEKSYNNNPRVPPFNHETFVKEFVTSSSETSAKDDPEQTFKKEPMSAFSHQEETDEKDLFADGPPKTDISYDLGRLKLEEGRQATSSEYSPGNLETDGDCVWVEECKKEYDDSTLDDSMPSGTNVDTGSDLTAEDMEIQAVRHVLEMGWESKKIKEALNILRSRRKGHKHFSTTQLLDILTGTGDFEILQKSEVDQTPERENQRKSSKRPKSKECCIS